MRVAEGRREEGWGMKEIALHFFFSLLSRSSLRSHPSSLHFHPHPLPNGLLTHSVMVVCHRSHDRLVRDAKNLMPEAELVQFFGDRLRHPPRNADINFVKNQRPNRIDLGKASLERQQKTAHLTTRRDFRQGLQGFSRIGAKQEGNLVRSVADGGQGATFT